MSVSTVWTPLYTPSTPTCTLTLLQWHLQNLTLMNHNCIYFEPIPQSKPGNACDSALSSSQPCLSKLPLILHSSHGEQIGTLSILFISLPEHGYPCLSHEYPWKASWILCFPRHSFARDGVISKYWSGKRTKQADCPNVDTHPPSCGKWPREKRCSGTQVQISRFHLTLKSQGDVMKGQIKDKSHLHLLKEEKFRPSQGTILL